MSTIGPMPPLIEGDAMFSSGVFNGNVLVYGKITATTGVFINGEIANLTSSNATFTTASVTNLTATNLTASNATFTTASVTNLAVTNLDLQNGLFGIPFTTSYFTASGTIAAAQMYNGLVVMNSASATTLTMPASTAIATAAGAMDKSNLVHFYVQQADPTSSVMIDLAASNQAWVGYDLSSTTIVGGKTSHIGFYSTDNGVNYNFVSLN